MGVAYWAILIDSSCYEYIDLKFPSDVIRYLIASSIPQAFDDDLFRTIDTISIFVSLLLFAVVEIGDVYRIWKMGFSV